MSSLDPSDLTLEKEGLEENGLERDIIQVITPFQQCFTLPRSVLDYTILGLLELVSECDVYLLSDLLSTNDTLSALEEEDWAFICTFLSHYEARGREFPELPEYLTIFTPEAILGDYWTLVKDLPLAQVQRLELATLCLGCVPLHQLIQVRLAYYLSEGVSSSEVKYFTQLIERDRRLFP